MINITQISKKIEIKNSGFILRLKTFIEEIAEMSVKMDGKGELVFFLLLDNKITYIQHSIL